MSSNLNNSIQKKEFLITCELSPPKGSNYHELIEHASTLKGLLNAINITDGQGGNMRMCSHIASHLVERETGIETICQIVCRDRNRIGLQSDILGAAALGIKNFLALSGDKAAGGDHPEAKDVFDLGTDDLVKVFKQFAQNLDLSNNKLDNLETAFCVGAAAHPGLPDLKSQAQKMKDREEEGVKFFQTQIVYELDQLKSFMDSITNISAPVLIGITPLKSVKMAKFMNEKVYGVTVPDKLIEKLDGSANPQEEGIKLALELIHEVKNLGGKGVHIMAIGNEKRLNEIISQIK
ncbi:MAG: methylenetetrahydrofolate reductase [Candidatus Caenarcaniphilales bacterium]|nr:methylenetetrahydrofolate reductase [Candidatus Caenarcaniphilales bacterium]